MDSRKVVVKQTRKYGNGVFAKSQIRKGEVIAAFDGSVYTYDYEYWNEDLFNHVIQFAPKKWRDSKGIARWINHSCEPNCGIKSLFKIVAMRNIKKGEQITWDYDMTERNPDWRMRCRCGYSECRKVIGRYLTRLPKKFRSRYQGYISAWLLK
jgi:SET domain-containing protein